MSSSPVTVIYLMGHPYSGSTLLSIALGNSDKVINLGEISFIENDYGGNVRCLCGHTLSECVFWCKVKTALDKKQIDVHPDCRFQLSNDSKLSGPDKRHKSLWLNLKMLFNIENAIPEAELENYAHKNERFFHTISDISNCEFIVDDSKSPHRLSILLKRTDIKLKVIWLQRNMRGLYASRVKRDKIRNRNYHPVFTPIVSIGWLLYHYWASKCLFDQLLESQKVVIHYEDFVKDPAAVQKKLSDFLGVAIDFNINSSNIIGIRDQHVFVGNRWLFKEVGLKQVRIRALDSSGNVEWVEEFLYHIFSFIFPILQK